MPVDAMEADTSGSYVHGYGEREAGRLLDQADSVRELIHRDTTFPAGRSDPTWHGAIVTPGVADRTFGG